MPVFNAVIAEQNGKELRAYVTEPLAKPGPGIILMHEVYGVTAGLKEIADELSKEGFVVACPNMYWRGNPDASFKYDPPPEVMAAMPEDERKKLNVELARDRDAARDCMFSAMEDERSTEKILETINLVA
ncbi:MAG TPA: dienelactone hydrolase family protein, partial [Alphaproteobacteria bacterium]